MNSHDAHRESILPAALAGLVPAVLVLAALAGVGMLHFLVLHVIIELFTVCVSFAAFLIAWNMRKRMDNGFFLLLAIAYASVSILDLAHLLTYRGMDVFPGLSVNTPTQLWVAARYVQAFSLLVAPLFIHQTLPVRPAICFYIGVVAGLLLIIFRPWPFLPAFPDCYVEGALPPLTAFKIASEYIICGILLLALFLLVLVRRSLDRAIVFYMVGSIVATMISEFMFTRYADVFGSFSRAGHLLKGLAFYLTYKALVEAELVRPFEVLFRSASQSRRQVLESEERFRTLSAATFEGIAITENGRIVDVNEQLLLMLGCRREELIGEPITSFLVPDDRERVLQSIRNGLEGQVDYRMIRRDGSFVHAETHGKMVHFKNRTVRVTAIRDITERKRAEQSLLEARNNALRSARELARSNADLDLFANVTSHDLKEPLRMVTGFLGLLRDQYDARLDERGREYIQFASDSARRMQRLIDDLLEYARVGTENTREYVALEEAVAAAKANLHIAIRSSGAVITCDPLPAVTAGRLEMTLLFQNLLSNAVKFRSEKTPEIRIGVRIGDVEPEYFISDNGIGIDPAYHQRLFQIFQRMHPAEDYPGSGLGLAICKKIVERYGGAIRVESQTGLGATFFFTLPDARRGDARLSLPPGESGIKLTESAANPREGA